MALISVIMPAYNSEKTIKKAIESILNQTFKDFELIIIDDGSLDETLNIIKDYSIKDDRIIFETINNSGSAYARNVGLENANGNYISFVDSDDIVEKEFLQTLYNVAIIHNVDIVSANYKYKKKNRYRNNIIQLRKGLFDKSQLENEIYPYIIQPTNLKSKVPITMWTKLFNRELIEKNNIRFIHKLRMSQDVIFTITCLLHANSFYNLPNQHVYNYIHNPNSRTNTYLENTWDILKENTLQLKKLSDKFPMYDLHTQLPYSLVRNSMTTLRNIGFLGHKNKKKALIQIENLLQDNDLEKALNIINTKKLSIDRKIIVLLMKNKNIKILTHVVLNSKYFI